MSKIAIGLSGGVDSSVSAYLLKEQGHDLIGVFMRFWHDDKCQSQCRENTCCNADSYHLAQRLCIKLNIPLVVFDFQKEFKKHIVDEFISYYNQGKTPNPCIICNEKIKIGLFYKEAVKKLKVEKIATGHYARIKKIKNYYYLQQSADPHKDQTYFLYRLPQNILANIIFPVGDYSKEEIKNIATQELNDLNLHSKKESQDICFISDSVGEFLQRNLDDYIKPGPIITKSGEIIGQHNGLAKYTIGQRKGINIGGGNIYYVTKIDRKKNQLIVGPKEEIFVKEIYLKKIILSPQYLVKDDFVCLAQVRYQSPLSRVKVEQKSSKMKLIFETPQFAPTPGQHCVLYDKNLIIGGGEII